MAQNAKILKSDKTKPSNSKLPIIAIILVALIAIGGLVFLLNGSSNTGDVFYVQCFDHCRANTCNNLPMSDKTRVYKCINECLHECNV